ncbi:N-acetylglucosamine-6-phosphate deacetylase [Coprothermobacteraceae bacterium]|nr:N-acetylglucosamine-6-phosphate deacetylase [Coprothermobacteraceae bacterium]
MPLSWFRTSNLFTPYKVEGEWFIGVEHGRVSKLTRENPKASDEVVDFGDALVAPGFVEVHIHGAHGYDVMSGTLEAMNEIARFLVRHGVTSFLPTTVPSTFGQLAEVLSLDLGMIDGSGARALGFHLEGPYVNPQFKGALPREALDRPDVVTLNALLGKGKVSMVTVAPELEGMADVIAMLTQRGVAVSLGHTGASYTLAVEAFLAGAKSITHFLNAMKAFHHRDSGVIGAALNLPFYVQFIPDGIHTSREVIRAVARLLSKRLVLITDAIMAAGMGEEQQVSLGGQQVTVRDGAARLSDGTLAGSTLTTDKGVRNLIEVGLLSIEEALICATVNPADLLGIREVGRIMVGSMADFVVLDRHSLEVVCTVRGGRIVYSRL